MTNASPAPHNRLRYLVGLGVAAVEDTVYVGLGVVLSAAAIFLLFRALRTFVMDLWAGTLAGQIITLLDEILLILLVIELLYTVQVSFREHTLVAEPFLVLALIATVRKILVLTAVIAQVPETDEIAFRHLLAELGLLSIMVLVLVGSLILLKRQFSSTHAGELMPPPAA